LALGVAPFEENVMVIDGVADAVNRSETRSAKCEPSAIGGELERPVRMRGALPEYPRRLRDAGTKGSVVIAGRLSADGLLTGVRVLRTAHADLAAVSVEFRFAP